MAVPGGLLAVESALTNSSWILALSQGVGLRNYYMPDLTMQGGWVAVRSALNLGAPRAARAQGGGWVVLCRSVLQVPVGTYGIVSRSSARDLGHSGVTKRFLDVL